MQVSHGVIVLLLFSVQCQIVEYMYVMCKQKFAMFCRWLLVLSQCLPFCRSYPVHVFALQQSREDQLESGLPLKEPNPAMVAAYNEFLAMFYRQSMHHLMAPLLASTSGKKMSRGRYNVLVSVVTP